MIDRVFQIITNELDDFFNKAPSRIMNRNSSTNNFEDFNENPQVKYIELLLQDEEQDTIKFPLNKVTPLLINLAEESTLRPAERFSRVSPEGKRETILPDVRLNLSILFVSHFYDYSDALYYLGLIVKYFQANPVLNQQNTPDMDEEIDELVIELISLPLMEQNEVWNALRSAYKPSIMYRVKMLVFQTAPSIDANDISAIKINTNSIDN